MMTTADNAKNAKDAAQLNGISRAMRQTIYHRPTATVRANVARMATQADQTGEDTETRQPAQDTEN